MLPPVIAPVSLLRISGSDMETASDTFERLQAQPPPYRSEARIAGPLRRQFLRHRFVDAERPRQARRSVAASGTER